MATKRTPMPYPAVMAGKNATPIDQLLTGEEIRLLAEMAFMGARRGLHREGQAIFGALRKLRPQRALHSQTN